MMRHQGLTFAPGHIPAIFADNLGCFFSSDGVY